MRLFRKIFAVHRYLTATHIGYSPQARHRVNCPKVKRRSSVGYPHRTTRSSVGTADGTYELQLLTNFTVGCGKVNCGNAAREGALGYDLGAPHLTISTCYPRRGAHCAPTQRKIKRFSGEQCSPLRLGLCRRVTDGAPSRRTLRFRFYV